LIASFEFGRARSDLRPGGLLEIAYAYAYAIEQPTNQGTYRSYYVLIMLGASTWF
jgi:hypothetical protein